MQCDELLEACEKAVKMLDNPDAEYATTESTSEFLTAAIDEVRKARKR